MELSQIITEYIRDHGYTIKELAHRAGITTVYMGKLKRGNMTNPSAKVLESLAKAMDMTTEELMRKLKDQTFEKMATQRMVGYELVPLFSNLSCTAGYLVDEEAENYIPIPESWRKPNKSYFAISAYDDSMTGREIHESDILIFERTELLESGEIGAFCVNGKTLCRTFRRLSTDTILLEPANSRYMPILIDLKKDTNFRTLGRLTSQVRQRLGA